VSAGRHRRDRVAAALLERGSVTIEGLMAELGASRMTVHRHLDALEALGLLRKVRGGATAARSTLFESSVEYRRRIATREKEAIAEAALSLVAPGQAVMLDESTTMLPLARRLPSVGPLTVISDFVAVQQILAHDRSVRFHRPGRRRPAQLRRLPRAGLRAGDPGAARRRRLPLGVGDRRVHGLPPGVGRRRHEARDARLRPPLRAPGRPRQARPQRAAPGRPGGELGGEEQLAELREGGAELHVASWGP
jgi:DNA-binding MarR family transcriptional regulator